MLVKGGTEGSFSPFLSWVYFDQAMVCGRLYALWRNETMSGCSKIIGTKWSTLRWGPDYGQTEVSQKLTYWRPCVKWNQMRFCMPIIFTDNHYLLIIVLHLFYTSPLYIYIYIYMNSSPPGQNGRYFADYIFGCIFMNEKFYIKISLKFVPNGPIGNNPALV